MNINEAFPSKYLSAKAGDLKGQRHTLTIARIAREDGIDKPILYFHNAKKGLALNKTNAMMIAHLYGPETDGWIGKQIELYEAQVMFNNEFVPSIRVQGPPPQMPSHQGTAGTRPVHPAPDPNAPSDFQQPSQHGSGGDDLDDSIPFAPCIH